MPDGYELTIVDYFPNDDLRSITDVSPGDDFDQDTYSNVDEINEGTNPVDPFSKPASSGGGEETAYDVWRFNHFGDDSGQGTTDPNADPEQDNIPNKFEYALLLDPNIEDVEGLPRFSIEQVDGQSYFTLEFRRRATLEDFQIIVEVSDNLRDWQSGPEVTTVLSVESSGITHRLKIGHFDSCASGFSLEPAKLSRWLSAVL